MPTASIVCLCLAYALVLLSRVPLWLAMRKLPGGFDNKTPRAAQDQLEGYGARARGAHYNTLEAFGPFAVGILLAHAAGFDPRRTAILGFSFLVVRLAYLGAYLANLDGLRSLLWSVGAAATGALYVAPLLP